MANENILGCIYIQQRTLNLYEHCVYIFCLFEYCRWRDFTSQNTVFSHAITTNFRFNSMFKKSLIYTYSIYWYIYLYIDIYYILYIDIYIERDIYIYIDILYILIYTYSVPAIVSFRKVMSVWIINQRSSPPKTGRISHDTLSFLNFYFCFKLEDCWGFVLFVIYFVGFF